ncbi:hypothetical protein PUMCH_005013 [Australozyma saopauloensis]|uniref:Rho-GAP domain-containing protein n=1 Tax=Australozyma saopauloensis TaxID=291208 RepID=A0AAX4HG87_9ASCO|nr:hypothetical protein PUMCH_005013 [[Candida] saopauloensis]
MATPLFANSYWSPDYSTGIGKLARQLRLSLGQLHELRQYILTQVKIHLNNGESLDGLAQSSYPFDSAFRLSRGQRQVSGVRKISGRITQEAVEELDLDLVYRQFTQQSAAELQHYKDMAAKIETQILEPLTAFLKQNEPVVKASINALSDLVAEYEAQFNALETVKSEYNTIARLGEFQGSTLVNELITEESTNSEDVSVADVSVANDSYVDTQGQQEAPSLLLELHDIELPLVLGGSARFDQETDFASFIRSLILSVPTSQRKIHLPGYRDEIFRSEDLSEGLRTSRLKGFAPTRANIEKFGQDLSNLKLIVGTGFFAKRFKSEGMWFEWSSAALEIAQLNEHESKQIEESNSQLTKVKLDEAFSTMAVSTSKTFSGVLKSVTSSLGKQKFSEEALAEAEVSYNEAYDSLQLQKHKLEMLIFEVASRMEQFEKSKIQTILTSLNVLQKLGRELSKALEQLSRAFDEKISLDPIMPNISQLELTKTCQNFGSGIYFPSLLLSDSASSGTNSITLLNTNFQNIKLNFNLYKDIPLQLSVAKAPEPTTNLLERSMPFFLYEILRYLDSSSTDELKEEWFSPINHQDAWLVKDGVLSVIQELSQKGNAKSISTIDLDFTILQTILEKMRNLTLRRLINFFKHWLLEVSDSVIPSTVFDSLIKHYKLSENETSENELVKILGTIPRSNLSSLIRILHHMRKVLSTDLETHNDSTESNSIKSTVERLNSMSSVGAVPFLHLIMRPSVLKHSAGFKPPLQVYNAILLDLFNNGTISKLEEHLIVSEEHYAQRQEQQRFLFDQQLNGARARSTSLNSEGQIPSVELTLLTPKKKESVKSSTQTLPKTPKRLGVADGDNFSLRPFRTGTTPRPSPSSSPVHRFGKLNDQLATSEFKSP